MKFMFILIFAYLITEDNFFLFLGWTQAAFSDVDWPYALTLGNNSQNSSCENKDCIKSWNYIPGIAEHSKWIWTNDYDSMTGDLIVYCRGHIASKYICSLSIHFALFVKAICQI